MRSLLLLALIAVISYRMGSWVLPALGIRSTTWADKLTWNTAVGLGLVGLLFAVMGTMGVLYRAGVVGLTVLAAAWTLACSWWHARTLVSRRRAHVSLPLPGKRDGNSAARQGVEESRSQGDVQGQVPAWVAPPLDSLTARLLDSFRLDVAIGVAATACAVAALIGALAPPTAGDAMCYHLELPKQFLVHHALVYVPDSDNSTYPLLMEMFFVWGLALEGGVLAQLVHWLTGVLLAGAAVVVARPLLGGRGAWLAGTLVLLVPGVTNQMTAPLNDLGLALYTTLAVAAALKGIRTERPGWYVLTGLCLGLAMGVKLLGAMFAVALGIMLVVPRMRFCLTRKQRDTVARRWRTQPFSLAPSLLVSLSGRPGADGARSRFAAVLLCACVAVLVGGGWYVRSYAYTGNPVYPFLGNWFATGRTDALPERKRPLAATAEDVLRTPWALTMYPEQFGGRANQLGVMFLALSPGFVLVRRRGPLSWLLAVAALYVTLWYLLRQNLRFLLPVVPLLTVIAVRVLLETRRFHTGPRWVIVACIGLLAAFSVAIASRRVRDRVAVAVGAEPVDRYLARQEPTYVVARWANAHLRDDAVILSQDFRAFYFQRRLVRENIYRRRTAYDRQMQQPADLPAALRARGFTHVLLAEAAGPDVGRYDTQLSRLLKPYETSLPSAFEHEYRGPQGGRIHYRLVALERPHAARRLR